MNKISFILSIIILGLIGGIFIQQRLLDRSYKSGYEVYKAFVACTRGEL